MILKFCANLILIFNNYNLGLLKLHVDFLVFICTVSKIKIKGKNLINAILKLNFFMHKRQEKYTKHFLGKHAFSLR